MGYLNLSFVKQRHKRFIDEIGPITNPYQDKFKFTKQGPDYTTSFNDSDGDKVTIKFELTGNRRYNVGYDIGGQSQQYKKSSVRNLLRIISSVATSAKQFLADYDPLFLEIRGVNKPITVNGKQFERQKNNIYHAYIGSNITTGEYEMGHLGGDSNSDDFEIRKITPEAKEAAKVRKESSDIWLRQYLIRTGKLHLSSSFDLID